MPFTPIHMGPGMVVKAAMPRHFSLVVFGLTQIAIDIEVLWFIARWDPPLHRGWHTILGATVVALALGLLGKPSSQWIKTLWNRLAERGLGARLTVSVPTTWTASFAAAFVGAYSHIFLDSLYHGNIEPLRPWSAANRFHGVFHPVEVEIGCLVLGVVGLVWYFGKRGRARKTDEAPSAILPSTANTASPPTPGPLRDAASASRKE